jgi:hypothetical protein
MPHSEADFSKDLDLKQTQTLLDQVSQRFSSFMAEYKTREKEICAERKSRQMTLEAESHYRD